MSQLPAEIKLTPEELYLLASLLRLPTVFGLDDPFLSARADEMLSLIRNAKTSLTEHGYLADGPSGLAPIASIANLLRLNTSAHTTLMISRTPPDSETLDRFIHVRGASLIAQESAKSAVVFSELPDAQRVHERAQQWVAIAEGPPYDGLPITLSRVQLNRVQTLVDGEDRESAHVLLTELGATDALARAVIASLAGELEKGSLVVIRREPKRMSYGERVAWLVGPDGSWQAEAVGDPRRAGLRLAPASGRTIRDRIDAIVNRSLATHE